MNMKHQEKSSNQLTFYLPANIHLWKLERAIFQKHKKYKLSVWKIPSLILMIKMIWKRKWLTWLGCTRQCKKNWRQHHIQNKSKFVTWYLINGLECTVQNILMSLNTLFELRMKSKSRWNFSKTCSHKIKIYRHWSTSSGNKRLWRWQFH